MGDQGDWTRRKVLDPVMLKLAKVNGGHFIDIGCGEGRFVRTLGDIGMAGIGIDPTETLIAHARKCDPNGNYHIGDGEKLDFDDAQFDLSISYMALIDIPDFRAAIAEMVRVTKPGGQLLIANLTSFFTAGRWRKTLSGQGKDFPIDHYSEERSTRERWQGIDIINHHRPLSAYMQCFLSHGLVLEYFDEPIPEHDGSVKSDRYTRVPGFTVMQWRKPV
ncbi:class I SAM-dependent methyltransferase [Parasphingorhabdus sp. DH2-15]|uniref:class I SAM-dependent methyltransferase n=1 Tax=Parasphingorhabdus sp. DH2-15 TaxID=3444112 RepID=UPI003F6858D1